MQGQMAMQVAVPEGMAPGAQFQCMTPDGQTLQIAVPEGMAAGAIMQVGYTPLPGAVGNPMAVMAQPQSFFPQGQLPPYVIPAGTKILPLSGLSAMADSAAVQVAPDLFQVRGTRSNLVQIPLQQGWQVTTEPGAMCAMSDGVVMKAKIGGFRAGAGRMLSGESLFGNTYVCETATPGFLSITPSWPGLVIPLNLSAMGGDIVLKVGSWMGHLGPMNAVDVSPFINDNMKTCCCTGLDFLLQRVAGQGWVFVTAGGTLMQRMLEPGETIMLDGDAVVGFQTSVEMDVKRTGNMAMMCCGGEGLTYLKMTGPGLVLIETMGLKKLKKAFPAPPAKPASSGGDGGDGGDGGGDGGGGGE
jgi:uncharacterized protein (AIM24 family)